MLALFFFLVPTIGSADIIWSGDFSTGDFSQWHGSSGPPPEGGQIRFGQTTPYGRPIDYGFQADTGNGDLMELVAATPRTVDGISFAQGPTRGPSEYSVKMTVKSLAGGGVEPRDCDFNCDNDRRRTALHMQAAHSDFYNALPNHATRWFSCSIFLPSGYLANTSGWGGPSCGLKPKNEAGGQGNTYAVSAGLDDGVWKLWNRWNNDFPTPELGQMTWQHMMFYTGNEDGAPYPRADFWPEGLVHFPDIATSHAALQNVNKGGWTDWVFQLNSDSRGAVDGGQGFLRIWKREDNGPWIFVLNVFPGQMTRGDITFDHGIGYDVRATNNNGGYGMKVQSYMSKSQVWNDPHNKVVYYGNIRVGDENATFSDMSPDGSTPGPSERPKVPLPPALLTDN